MLNNFSSLNMGFKKNIFLTLLLIFQSVNGFQHQIFQKSLQALKSIHESEALVSRSTDSVSLANCFNSTQLCLAKVSFLGKEQSSDKAQDVEVIMKLYKYNYAYPQNIPYNDSKKLGESHFDATNNTIFIIHGLFGSCSEFYVDNLVKGFFRVDKYSNVFCVNWDKASKHLNILKDVANSLIVADMLTYFISLIDRDYTYINNRTHLVGFGAGAHIAGMTGFKLPDIKRITGLDPMGLIYNVLNVAHRLDKGDAFFVDVIHTNGKSGLLPGLGTVKSLGHIDFFPNGGENQPGCKSSAADIIQIIFFGIEAFKLLFFCSHMRAATLFYESMTEINCTLYGFPCQSYEDFLKGFCFNSSTKNLLGYYAPSMPGNGSRYLTTRSKAPYCGTQYFVHIEYKPPSSSWTVYYRGFLLLTVLDGLGREDYFRLLDGFFAPGMKNVSIVVKPGLIVNKLKMLYRDDSLFLRRESLEVDVVKLTDINGNTSYWEVVGKILYRDKEVFLQRINETINDEKDESEDEKITKEESEEESDEESEKEKVEEDEKP